MEYKTEYLQLAKNANTLTDLITASGLTQKHILILATQTNETDEIINKEFYLEVKRIVESIKSDITEKTKQEKLNPQQELFCQLYATDREFFGNGVQSYIEAYEPDKSKPNWYKSACVSASQLLSNIKVCNRINELLEVGGLNDQNVDKELLFVITQHADFSSKVAAIREYNKLKKRIIERIDHTTNGKELPTPIYGGQSTETI